MEVSKDYLKGFNSGYIVRKNHPLLMKKLLNGAKGNSDLIVGIKDGGKQFEREIQHKMRLNSKKMKLVSRSKDHGMEID